MTDDRPLIGHVNLAAGFRGGERQTELLIGGLSGRGWRQRLVARRGEPLAMRCAGFAGLDIVETSAGMLSTASTLSGVRLTHVHQGRSLKAAFAHHFFGGAPYLVTRRIQKGPSRSALNRFMYRRAAAVVALSSAVAGSLQALEPSLRPLVIPSASSGLTADPGAAADIRARAGHGFVVGHVGALDDSHKGQLQLIEIAKRLASEASDVRFVLVGGGRDEAILKVAAAGLPNMHFAGQVDNVGDYLGAFDAFVYPSRHEGLGSILLDVLAFGLPVVATRVGGIPDVIDSGVNGFLLAVDDLDAMTAAILRLRHDPGLTERIAAANRIRAGQFAPEVMVGRYEALYQQLLAADR